MSNPRNKEELLYVATLGRAVGLKGDMKLHDKSDFPEQFKRGAEFILKNGQTIRLEHVNMDRGTVRIEGVSTPEDAKRYTNADLYTTYEATRQNCQLEEGEHFWFDIIGCEVVEDGRELGVVTDMERIGAVNYLAVKTDELLVAQGEVKSFLIPLQPPFVLSTDVEKKRIEVEGGLDLLRAS
jgi:16S rRNA processing protein RimM